MPPPEPCRSCSPAGRATCGNPPTLLHAPAHFATRTSGLFSSYLHSTACTRKSRGEHRLRASFAMPSLVIRHFLAGIGRAGGGEASGRPTTAPKGHSGQSARVSGERAIPLTPRDERVTGYWISVCLARYFGLPVSSFLSQRPVSSTPKPLSSVSKLLRQQAEQIYLVTGRILACPPWGGGGGVV